MIVRILLVAVLAVASAAAGATQQPVFSARTESVRVDALVTEGGRIVRDLGPGDFELRDEGVLQQVELASFEQAPLNVVLALDVSYSVSGERLDQLRLAARVLLDGLRPNDQAAVLTFDAKVAVPGRLSGDTAGLRAVLGRLTATGSDGPGGTALADGAYAAMVLSEAAARRALVVVFSDGVDTGSWLTRSRVLDAARRLDVVLYGVTLKGSGDSSLLRELAIATGGDLVETQSLAGVRSTFVRILEEFRSRYWLSYSPRGVSGTGWHRLEVRVKGRRATVKARPGYMAGS